MSPSTLPQLLGTPDPKSHRPPCWVPPLHTNTSACLVFMGDGYPFLWLNPTCFSLCPIPLLGSHTLESSWGSPPEQVTGHLLTLLADVLVHPKILLVSWVLGDLNLNPWPPFITIDKSLPSFPGLDVPICKTRGLD